MPDQKLGLEILQEVSRIANSSLDLDHTLESIIQIIKQKMHTDACALYITQENKRYLNLRASSGLPKEASTRIRLEIGKGITGWVAEQKTSLALSDAMHDPRFTYFPEIEEEKFNSMLSVPIILGEECIGIINVHTLEKRVFDHSEISLLEAIAEQVAGCLRNAVLYNKSQMHLHELSILYDVSLAVQSTLKQEHGLWIILNGITMGKAGGFNRALLFMYDEKEHTLHGMMGLGPDSYESAVRVWTELEQKGENLLQWIITAADREEYNKTGFNQFVRSLKLRVDPGKSFLSELLAQKKALHIDSARGDTPADKEFLEALGTNTFAVAPLVAQESVMGIILADNRYNGKPITEDQLRLLTRFSTHASWVMENSRLFSKLLDTNRELLSTRAQLTQSEKFAALGEMAAEVAHEIKNPLVSIGGFARRLRDKMQNLSSQDESDELKNASNYSAIIVKEVERLEHLLQDILLYSKSGILAHEPCNINEILEEVAYLFQAGFYEKKIDLKMDLGENLSHLKIDRQRIKQVLINLFYNAMDAMSQGGDFSVTTRNDVYAEKQPVVTVRLEDTGGGISSNIFDNMFNPFFTTKATGTGMGLPISRKIIEAHGGTIRVENTIGRGVTIVIHLPLQIPPDYYKS